jgi:hypothetical protein
MKKFITSIIILSFITMNIFAFVPLSNQQLSLGSFCAWATCGMFYDELDIISAHPVSLLEFSGNSLYTTWGNVRNSVDVSYNRILVYNRAGVPASNDNTFVFGIAGDPLSNFGIKDSRMGFVFQNLGSTTNYYDLNNVAGNDSEGNWKDVTGQNVGGDYQFDLEDTLEAKDLIYYDNRAVNQYNFGFAKKGLIFGDITAGISVARISDYTKRITGGEKSYQRRYFNDTGAASDGLPAGTTIGDTYKLTYAKNDGLINSSDITDLLAQVRLNDLLPNLRLDVAVGLRIQNNYNPNGLTKNAHTVNNSWVAVNNAGNGVVYDTGKAIRDVVTALGGGNLDYNDFTNLYNDFNNAKLWTPGWRGGQNANDSPGLSDFSDDRKGLGGLIRAEAGYKLFNIPITGVFNLSLVPQKLDSSRTYVDYIELKTHDTTQANDPLATWIARDYKQTVKSTGDINNTVIDFGLKFDFIKAEYLQVSFGGFITGVYQLSDYKTKIESREITSYDDGLAGNNPGTVSITNRPRAGTGEGIWIQDIKTETTNRDETLTTIISVPVGAEIPITKKWTFRAGTVYNMTMTKQTSKATKGRTTTVTSVTPAGGATTTQTVIADNSPALTESVVYTETHQVSYTYGIEWRPNKNLILACNAFLDTNPNPSPTTKATIFDLDTYRLLAIQAIFKF